MDGIDFNSILSHFSRILLSLTEVCENFPHAIYILLFEKIFFTQFYTMKKSKPKIFDHHHHQYTMAAIKQYGSAVRIVTNRHQSRSNHNLLFTLPVLSMAYKCILLVPFPLRRLITKSIRVRL